MFKQVKLHISYLLCLLSHFPTGVQRLSKELGRKEFGFVLVHCCITQTFFGDFHSTAIEKMLVHH